MFRKVLVVDDIDFNDISIQNVNMQQLMKEIVLGDNMKIKSGSINFGTVISEFYTRISQLVYYFFF